jgi:uncharacterized Zn finger protein
VSKTDEFNDLASQVERFLSVKAPKMRCSMCSKDSFVMVKGFHRHEFQADIKKMAFPGVPIPAITLICKNCGYVHDFSLKHMNLVENESIPFEEDGNKNAAK